MAVVEVVKYDGNPDVFAWKYPNNHLGTWTQVIVNEAQEAVLFKGGQALDILGPGRHTLSTANIPILSKLIKLPFGGMSPFIAEVWYINKTHSLDIKWGTPTPIQLQDPKFNIFVPLRSFGQFGIQVASSKVFLTKLVGTLSEFDKDNLVRFFRGLYLTKVKDTISSYLINKGISVLEINAYLIELSDYLEDKIKPTLEEYGLNLLNFFVNDINVPEDDPAVRKLKDALAKKAEMDIIGYNYVQERSFDTLEGAATNPGGGQAGVMGAGIGLGMGFGIGGAVGTQAGGLAQNINTAAAKKCPNCNGDMSMTARFCESCGNDTQKSADAVNNDMIECAECGHWFSKNTKFCPACGDPYRACTKCGTDVKESATACHKCGQALPKPCPKCGMPLQRATAKFCCECGEPLVRICANCGAQLGETQKFCPECGLKVNLKSQIS